MKLFKKREEKEVMIETSIGDISRSTLKNNKEFEKKTKPFKLHKQIFTLMFWVFIILLIIKGIVWAGSGLI